MHIAYFNIFLVLLFMFLIVLLVEFCQCQHTLDLTASTAAAVPPPFRPGEPALCRSHPL